MKRLLALGAVAAICCVPAHAQSQTFLEVIQSSAQRSTTGSNQISGPGVEFIVGRLRLNLGTAANAFVTYTVEGSADAFNRTQFFGPGGSSMLDSRAGAGAQITAPLAAGGILDFSFASVGANTVIANASNAFWNRSNFGIALDPSGLSGRLLFEDGRSIRPDYDYDDLVIRFDIQVAPVPEPGSVLLLLAGGATLGFMLRARRRPR
jgi:hypothetical protein